MATNTSYQRVPNEILYKIYAVRLADDLEPFLDRQTLSWPPPRCSDSSGRVARSVWALATTSKAGLEEARRLTSKLIGELRYEKDAAEACSTDLYKGVEKLRRRKKPV